MDPKDTTTSTTTGGQPGPAPEPAGIPRPVAILAVALALGFGIMVGSRLRPVRTVEVPGPTVEIPVPVAAPCQDCADRAALAASLVHADHTAAGAMLPQPDADAGQAPPPG